MGSSCQSSRVYGGYCREKRRRRARVLAYHALARSLALTTNPDRAIGWANKALADAVSAAEKGVAHFALGESYRHAGKLAESVKSYSKSERTAYISGNTDLYIWCKLSLSDSHLLLRDFENSERQLSHFVKAIKGRHEDHPLESLHWKLSDSITRWCKSSGRDGEMEVSAVASQYDDILGIRWPKAYAAAIRKSHFIAKHL